VSTTDQDTRGVRAAKNQSLFRDINERVQQINETFSVILKTGDWVCECADLECTERIELTADEYELVRSYGDRFIVARGHIYPDVERLVGDTNGYWVVEKIEDAAEVARRLDPRA